MGENKAELLYNGKTFVDNLIEKAKLLGIKQIYLSGHQQEQDGLKVVTDVYQGVGPIGGIHAGMKMLKTPYCLVLPVDVPQIPLEFLETLIEYHESHGNTDHEKNLPFVVEQDGFLEPLIGIYPAGMLAFIEEKIEEGRFSVFRMLQEWGCESITVNIPKWQIANINTRDDYENLLKMEKRQ